MKLVAVQPSPFLIAIVLQHLWLRGRMELRLLGLSRFEAAIEAWIKVERGSYSFVLMANDNPIIAAGICNKATWFLATNEFDRHVLEITRFVRKALQKHDAYIYSTLVHPKAERWFHALNYARDDWSGETKLGYPLYRFARR